MTAAKRKSGGRSPADTAKDCRQVVWAELRRRGNDWIPVAELCGDLGLQRKTVQDYLACLQAGGFIERMIDADTRAVVRIIKDGGHHAPRLRPDGSRVTQGDGLKNLWRSMQMKKSFSALDLMTHSSTPTVTVSLETAKSYCSMLLATGYLRVVEKANPSQDKLAVYRLIRNDGPKPPMIQRVKQVYDPNTGRVYRKAGQE